MSKVNENLSKEIAAHLFWNLVSEQGLPKTRDMLKSPRAYMKVFKGRAPAIITALTGGTMGKGEVRSYVADVVNQIKSYLDSEGKESLDGAIHIPEDSARFGDIANHIDYSTLPELASMCENGKFEKVGKLILRMPLPALVVVDKLPETPIIRVADVESALGYDADIYFTLVGYHKEEDGRIILSGVANIPLKDKQDLGIWRKIMPNMRGIYNKLGYTDGESEHEARICDK